MLEMQHFSAESLRLTRHFFEPKQKEIEQITKQKWLAYCLALFCFVLRTEGVKGGGLLPLTSATIVTKWLACGLLAKPLSLVWYSRVELERRHEKC